MRLSTLTVPARLAVTATLSACLLASAAARADVSPTWAALSAPPATEVFRVLQYLDTTDDDGDDAELVILNVGREGGVRPGSLLTAYRASTQAQLAGASAWIATGHLKAVDVQDKITVAEVSVQGSTLSKAFFPKFPGVMSGDLVVLPRVTLSRRQQVLPTTSISYFDLFEDPKGAPTTFELKSDGLERLKEAAKAFAEARVSLLMVEGYTDHNGPADASQIESYQRALTVRQVLIDELGFDEKRVVAIGYGEGEPVDASLVPGYVQANRRIVLKAVQLPGK